MSGEELPDRYLNRELSWLDFNARVLALAADESLPILERAKFLAIFASNLDEFYMVRVAGLKRRDETGLSVRSADGLSPREQLKLIGERTQEISVQHARVFSESVRPELAENGIFVVTWADLSENERSYLSSYFNDQVFPVLTCWPSTPRTRSLHIGPEPESGDHRPSSRDRRPAFRPNQGA